MTTPREDEVTEVVEVKPTEVSKSTEVEVDENEEKKIIETATESPTKHPMRPAKNSSSSYQSKPKFTLDQAEVNHVVLTGFESCSRPMFTECLTPGTTQCKQCYP